MLKLEISIFPKIEIQPVYQKITCLYYFLKKWRMFKFEKYRSVILGPSIYDSVANIENKFEKNWKQDKFCQN